MNRSFSDYVTSGAFNMALTRGQIADLSTLAETGARYVDRHGALERRGLIERVPAASDWIGSFEAADEWRLTAAGVLVVNLLFEAGLSNRGEAAMARECDALRQQLAAANEETTLARKRLHSLHARHARLILDVEQAKARKDREKFPVRVLPRDPLPDAPLAELVEGLNL